MESSSRAEPPRSPDLPRSPELKRRPAVILVTDGHRLAPGADAGTRVARLIEQARAAFAAGVDAVQIRESGLDDGVLFELVREVAREGPAIVTARADIALAAGAAGVHLRGDGPPSARVRAILPPQLWLSRAVHSIDEAEREARVGAADWLLAGTAFETDSKPGREPLGEAGIRGLCGRAPVPVIVIGGITAATAATAKRAGAAGVAAIGAFLGQITPEYVDSLRARY